MPLHWYKRMSAIRHPKLAGALWSQVTGWRAFRRTGQTPPASLWPMLDLFYNTGGISNDVMARLASVGHRFKKSPRVTGVLGDLDDRQVEAKLADLRREGYVVFPDALSADAVDRLLHFAMTTPAVIRPMDSEDRNRETHVAVYDPANVVATRYDYKAQDLLADDDVQVLLADESLREFAGRYIGADPIIDIVTMWWHTGFKEEADSMAAQLFHVDMDRLRWLKVFIYLTDVEEGDGPHTFIARTHRTGGIPWSLRQKGPVRWSDEEVLRHYGREREISLTGRRGTIILEDTRGLHKGALVRPGSRDRLVLQFEYCVSLYGQTYNEENARWGENLHPALERAIELHPRTYSVYSPNTRKPA